MEGVDSADGDLNEKMKGHELCGFSLLLMVIHSCIP